MITVLTQLNCPCCRKPMPGRPGYYYPRVYLGGGYGPGSLEPPFPFGACGCDVVAKVYKLVISGIVNSSPVGGAGACIGCAGLNGTFLLYYQGSPDGGITFNWSSLEQCNPCPGDSSNPPGPCWTLQCSTVGDEIGGSDWGLFNGSTFCDFLPNGATNFDCVGLNVSNGFFSNSNTSAPQCNLGGASLTIVPYSF